MLHPAGMPELCDPSRVGRDFRAGIRRSRELDLRLPSGKPPACGEVKSGARSKRLAVLRQSHVVAAHAGSRPLHARKGLVVLASHEQERWSTMEMHSVQKTACFFGLQ